MSVLTMMGKLQCGMQTQQWNNKRYAKPHVTMMQQYSIMRIILYDLSIFNVLTQSFSVLTVESFCRKFKKINIWQTNTATELIYTDLETVYGSDDGLKRKLTQVQHFLIYLEKCLSQLIMKQTDYSRIGR